MSFKSPRRRLTRQRSGFTVSGSTTGGECKIIKTKGTNIQTNKTEFNFKKKITLIKSFDNDSGFIAFGGYMYPEVDLSVEIILNFISSDGKNFSESKSLKIFGNRWNKIGVHKIFAIDKNSLTGILSSTLKIKSNLQISRIDFFGFELNVVDYYTNGDLQASFHQQTNIYLPEIYYFKPEKIFEPTPVEYTQHLWTEKLCIFLKSCNRCARFLPIDFDMQENDLAFSLHCKSRSPCIHSTFATYKVLQNDCNVNVNSNNQIQAFYGYQLECKPCKKFYVNWPLNPLRNSTQHREDSLRRRAFEELVGKLFGKKWIFHTFRLDTGVEFDQHIFEKFGKKCFKCQKSLSSRKLMALDHTFPIAALWPLDESATCLCQTCNSSKGEKFPVDFYSNQQLCSLSRITGLPSNILKSKRVNIKALEKLKKESVWFFDVFLQQKDYQKVRKGKLTADNIYRSLLDVVKQSDMNLDLIKEYEKIKKTKPKSITID